MSEDQKRIIREQLQANARMVRRNAERGVVYEHGQGPVNERVYQIQTFLMAGQRRSADSPEMPAPSRNK
jgi:hypothetical protein